MRKIGSMLGVVLVAAAVPPALPAQVQTVVGAAPADSNPVSGAFVQSVGPDGKTRSVDLTDGEQAQLQGQMMAGLMNLPEALRNKVLSGSGNLSAAEEAQVMREVANGMKDLPEGLKDKLFGDQKNAVEKALQEAGARSSDPSSPERPGLKNGAKVPIIVLDSVRVGEKDLEALTRSLREGKVRLRPNGVRKLTGDAPEAKQYGAGPGDEVIILSTEPAAP